MKNNNIFRIAIAVGLILLVPLIAMQFNDEVNWGLFDFVAMAALLFGAGLTIDFAVKKFRNPVHRVIVVVAITAALFIIWAELAVNAISKLLALLLG